MFARNNRQQAVVCWYDKSITLMFIVSTQKTCHRWPRKGKKKKMDVPRPDVVQLYNLNMGGVDLADHMISCYRIKARLKKWTIIGPSEATRDSCGECCLLPKRAPLPPDKARAKTL